MMKYDFVEIGTCDFDTIVQNSDPGSKGICVDTLKSYLDNLPDIPGVIKLNYAVSDVAGSDLFYYLENHDIVSYGLPSWMKGCGRLGDPHPFLLHELEIRDLKHLLKVMPVEKVPISAIFEKYLVTELDVLKLNLEGHDVIVLKSLLEYEKVLPNKIIFEFIPEISDFVILEECQKKLQQLGYVVTLNVNSNFTYERKFRSDGKNRIMVVTTFDDNYSEMAKMTAGQNFEIYCSLNNYALHKDYMGGNFERNPQWRKIQLLTELIRQDAADWFFFIDCDCLFMNFAQDLESYIDQGKCIITTKTGGAPDYPLPGESFENAFMSAQLLVKNSEISLKILEEIWNAPDWPEGLSINRFDHEMRQMRFTFEKSEWKNQIRILEQKALNAFWPSENPYFVVSFPDHNKNCWNVGDFIVHVVGRPKEDRIKLLYDLQIFSGGLLSRWEKEENHVFFETLTNVGGTILFAINSAGDVVGQWEFEALQKGVRFWIFTGNENIDQINFRAYTKDNLAKPISSYKFYTNPEFV